MRDPSNVRNNTLIFNDTSKVVIHLILYLIVCREYVCGSKQCTVFFETSTDVSVGDDIDLYCDTKGSSCTGAHKWIGGPTNEVISLVRGLLNHTKYSIELEERDGRGRYRLTIKNTLSSDFGVKYACLRGFDKFEGILKQKSHFNLSLNTRRNNTKWAVCMFANTTLVDERMNLNKYWLWKSLQSNASFERVMLGERFVEEMVDDGYNLCIESPKSNDFGKKYQLNYYSGVFEIVLQRSIFVMMNDNKKDQEGTDLKYITVPLTVVVLLLLILSIILYIRKRQGKKGKRNILYQLNKNQLETS